jgi:tRNA (cytidine/uridine-2'-O-)-methyltransferase
MPAIVLYEPEIPWNTGNIGRTCVAAGAALHLIEPLGFKLEGKEMRRAGMDYWPKLDLHRHASWDAFVPGKAPLFFFSSQAEKPFWEADLREGYFVFGRESSGLPPRITDLYKERIYRIPMEPGVRSLNLSTAAAVVLYESVKQISKR